MTDPTGVEAAVVDVARRARTAATELALANRGTKDRALVAMADGLVAGTAGILAANAQDVSAAEDVGTPASIVDRLRLDESRVRGMADGLRDVAGLPDPVGEVLRGSTLANGLELRQVRVPFGVVGIIYEARPNVTADAAGICLKSGNAVLLRGSSSAAHSNTAIVSVLRDAAAGAGLPADVVQLVPGEGHEPAKALMRARGLVDVLIPRGGAGLIRSVVEESTVPVIETGVGNCHVYVDADADLEQALAIVLNAKTHRPSVCNAAESLLVHADVAERFLPMVVPALQDAGVTIHGDQPFQEYDGVVAATDEDHGAEYLSLDISACRRTRPRRRDPAHPHLLVRTQRRDRHPLADRGATLHRGGRLRRGPGQRLAPGSPTAASSGSAPRSASPPRSCTRADRWGCRR